MKPPKENWKEELFPMCLDCKYSEYVRESSIYYCKHPTVLKFNAEFNVSGNDRVEKCVDQRWDRAGDDICGVEGSGWEPKDK